MKRPKILSYLRVQIALYYLLASLIMVSLLGVALYYNVSSIVMKDNLEATITAVDRSGKYIEVYIERLKAVSAMIAQNPQTIAYFSTHSTDENLKSNIHQLIETALKTDPFLVSVILVSKDGRIVSNEKTLDMSMSSDMMKEEWYVKAIQSSMPVLTSARMQKFSMNQDEWVVSISREITNEKGENIGVLLLDIRYQFIEDFLSGLHLGQQGYAFIINENKQIVFHKDTTYFQDEQKRQSLVEFTNMPEGYDANSQMLIHHTHMTNTDWTLVGVSSLDGLKNIRRQIMESLIFASLMMLMVVAFSGVFVANRLTNPIRKLECAMADIEKSLSHIEINEASCYEAQNLAFHFNEMMDRIQVLMTDVHDKEQELRSHEINALYSQINPHFLYNTLDTIIWMAEFNDQQKVIAVTKSLAQFFRLSLSKGEEMIPLENEVEHVKQYLFIQKQRYMEKLNYAIELDESIKSIKVPKIILQPIVENAIYHGIRELDHSGHINIAVVPCTEQGTDIQIVIKDNGVGFDMNVSNGSKTLENGVKLGGVGLKNVNQRIQLYYGQRYGVQIHSEIGKGTVVTIRLNNQYR